MLVDSQLSITVLHGLLNQNNHYDDMLFFDKQLYKSLNSLRQYAIDKNRESIIDSLGLTFEVVGSHGVSVELVPHGSEVAVTASNIYEYITKLANYRLNLESRVQMEALLLGFRSIIHANWIRMFSAHELQKLIGGEKRQIDVTDMQKYCKYAGGYHPSQPYIQV